MAPSSFHPWVLSLPLVAECPVNLLFGRFFMAGHSTDIGWEPTVCQRPASSEDVEMTERRAGPCRWDVSGLSRDSVHAIWYSPIVVTYSTPFTVHRSQTRCISFILDVLCPCVALGWCILWWGAFGDVCSVMVWSIYPGSCFTWQFNQKNRATLVLEQTAGSAVPMQACSRGNFGFLTVLPDDVQICLCASSGI